ncbi:peptide ABC transporter ATP-binding protein [Pandoraea pulmonicola]|uniref:Peptide ABC transporter ATP-binding protein n=2 Tax=Pandoraea pulmonicola TaxID=93221 RepID=A0ABM5S2P8_PANPU|nr:DMT family transporter [Pandoraea pulmonicola]AJC22020.1 peptide ABC transporter ATP-binding protein [Pandoraea pulmonicola]
MSDRSTSSASASRGISAGPTAIWSATMPWWFVLIWSTGFIVAKYGMPNAEPLTFLALRFGGTLLVMLPVALLTGTPWPTRQASSSSGRDAVGAIARADWALYAHLAVSGILIQAVYLGGVWAAIKHGVPAGLAALIVGIQPLLTALFARVVGEPVSRRQWLGLLCGFAGVGLVVANKLGVRGLSASAVALCVLSLFAITSGTLYQKRFCAHFDLRVGTLVQFGAAFAVTLPAAWALETMEVRWNAEMIGALAWSVLALSIGAISLLFLLIRHGAATKVSSLMYLTPPTTAVMAWLLFGETLSPLSAAGMVVAALGVALVIERRSAPASPAS